MYKNYNIIEEKFIKDIDSKCIILEHIKTKAKVCIIKNDDINKVFNISFRTPVSDNTGVPHILEHSVLCGSKKYPIKDPFVELAKSSFNTFLNAMTFPDKTCYPVASCNYKDFRNLIDVYLDAVFNPNIYKNKEILMQEGWHYEFDDEGNLVYNGVVYNEMKGVYSDPESLLDRQIYTDMFTGSNYAYEYGGNPSNIPDLTYENFIEFHKKYYHPSNSYIYLYGNMDFDEVLTYIDNEYLSKFNYKLINSHIERFKPFLNIKENICYYNDESGNNKDYISYSFAIKNSKSAINEIICLILINYLMDSNSGIVFNKLLNENLCEDSSGSFQNEQICGIFTFEARKTSAKNKDKFQRIIDDTIFDLYKNGFNQEKLLACVNKIKFLYREKDSGTMPKGLSYSFNILNSWLYDLDPFMFIEYEEEFDKIDEKIIKKFIKDNFIDNTSRVLVACIPNEKYFNDLTAFEKTKLTQFKESLNKNDLERIKIECKNLKTNQEKKDSFEDLKVLPTLTIQDIENKNQILKYKVDKIKVLKHKYELVYIDSNNNGIIYYSIDFDITKLNIRFYPFLSCINHFLSKLSTKNYTVDKINNLIDINTGDINFSIVIGKTKNYFSIKVKTLKENLEKSFLIIDEILSNTIFNDPSRITELIKNLKAESNNSILQAPHITCINEVSSYYSPSSNIERNFLIGSIGFNDFINELNLICVSDNENMRAFIYVMEDLMHYILSKPTNICLSCNSEENKLFKNKINNFKFSFLKNKPRVNLTNLYEKKYTFKSDFKNIAYSIPTDVSYVSRGCNLSFDKIPGTLLVLKTICSYDYLWTNIRVLGGAYGAILVANNKVGFALVSYRDPHIKSTNNVYDKLPSFLSSINYKKEEIEKYIIGTLSTFDMPKSNYLNFIYNISKYYNKITNKDEVKQRNEIINTNINSIKKVIKFLLKDYKKSGYTVISSNTKIKNDNNNYYKGVKKINV